MELSEREKNKLIASMAKGALMALDGEEVNVSDLAKVRGWVKQKTRLTPKQIKARKRAKIAKKSRQINYKKK